MAKETPEDIRKVIENYKKQPTLAERRTRGKRACPRCGFVRTVVIWLKPDGTDEYKPPLCGVCSLEQRASIHEYWARKFHLRADELRARRRKAGKR